MDISEISDLEYVLKRTLITGEDEYRVNFTYQGRKSSMICLLSPMLLAEVDIDLKEVFALKALLMVSRSTANTD